MIMTTMDSVNLREISLFKSLTIEETDKLHYEMELIRFKKGEIIFKRGSRLKGMYCVHKGVVKLFDIGSKGKDQIFIFLNRGDILGYDATVNAKTTDIGATAVEPVELLFIPHEVIVDFLEKNGNFRIPMLQAACKELEVAQKLMTDVAQKSDRQRIVEFLFYLKETYGIDDDGLINISLKRMEIANRVGACIESTIRILSDFKKHNLIRMQGKKIGIVNELKLKQYIH